MVRQKDEKAHAENEAAWAKEIEGVTTPADTPIQSYPPLQFISGKPGYAGHWRANGVFFVSDEADIKVTGKDWRKEDFVTTKGAVVPGNVAQAITCSVLRMRRAWEVSDDVGNTLRFPWDSYDVAKRQSGKKNPRGKMQIIMAVDGLEKLVALTLRGHLSKHAVTRGQWGEKGRRFLYDPAARVLHGNKKGAVVRLPSLCFKIRLGVANPPHYLEVGTVEKNSITPITLLSPKELVTEMDIGQFVVPRVLRESYEQAYAEADPWFAAWQEMGAVVPPSEGADGFEEGDPGNNGEGIE